MKKLFSLVMVLALSVVFVPVAIAAPPTPGPDYCLKMSGPGVGEAFGVIKPGEECEEVLNFTDPYYSDDGWVKCRLSEDSRNIAWVPTTCVDPMLKIEVTDQKVGLWGVFVLFGGRWERVEYGYGTKFVSLPKASTWILVVYSQEEGWGINTYYRKPYDYFLNAVFIPKPSSLPGQMVTVNVNLSEPLPDGTRWLVLYERNEDDWVKVGHGTEADQVTFHLARKCRVSVSYMSNCTPAAGTFSGYRCLSGKGGRLFHELEPGETWDVAIPPYHLWPDDGI